MSQSSPAAFKRVLILVFDGLSPSRVAEWVRAGELPAFARLMKEGAFGYLRSVVPPVTAPASAALVTGTQPGKNGIFDFYDVDPEKLARTTTVNHLGKSRVPTVVELCNLLRISVGVFGIPMLYPVPKPNDGFAVAGFGVPSNTRFAEPDPVYQLLREAGYAPSGTTLNPSDPEVPDKLVEEMERRWEIFKLLWRKYDPTLTICWLPETDHASHYFWDDHSKILRLYKAADRILEQVLDELDDDTLLIVASDHGFTSIEASFYPNALLWRSGFLFYKRSPITPVKLIFTRLVRWARRKSPTLHAMAVWGVAKKPPLLVKAIKPFVISSRDLDLRRTKALALGPSSSTEFSLIYLNKRIVKSPEEREKLLRDLAIAFSEVPEVEEVIVGSEIYSGGASGEAPDLVVRLKDEIVCLASSIPHDKKFLGGPPGGVLKGKHHLTGVIGILGKCVRAGASLDSRLYDVLPTALHALGYPIPAYSDGSPIIEAFAEDSPLRREVAYFSPLKLKSREVVRALRGKVTGRRPG